MKLALALVALVVSSPAFSAETPTLFGEEGQDQLTELQSHQYRLSNALQHVGHSCIDGWDQSFGPQHAESVRQLLAKVEQIRQKLEDEADGRREMFREIGIGTGNVDFALEDGRPGAAKQYIHSIIGDLDWLIQDTEKSVKEYAESVRELQELQSRNAERVVDAASLKNHCGNKQGYLRAAQAASDRDPRSIQGVPSGFRKAIELVEASRSYLETDITNMKNQKKDLAEKLAKIP